MKRSHEENLGEQPGRAPPPRERADDRRHPRTDHHKPARPTDATSAAAGKNPGSSTTEASRRSALKDMLPSPTDVHTPAPLRRRVQPSTRSSGPAQPSSEEARMAELEAARNAETLSDARNRLRHEPGHGGERKGTRTVKGADVAPGHHRP